MKSKVSFFTRQFFQLSLLLLVVFCVNFLAQNSPNYQTVAAKEKTEAVRPRITDAVKNDDEKPKTEDNSTPKILVTSAAAITQMERKVFDILNNKRKENGLPPIVWSEDMAKVARLHSESMAKNKFFSHIGLDGSMVNDRADQLGFSKWRAIGENIAYNHGFDNPAEFACQRWMLSQSHRENILNPRWKEAGVGVAITADGTYYFTEVFILKY